MGGVMIGRAEARQALREPFDLIVVGAGVNGSGIARDAALRGLKELLLDKGDFGSGTTSWSSRLIHGGLRYLEHREVGLVRESLRERERLLAMAPHLVKPLALLIPLYRGAKRGPNLVRLGMIAYDILSFDKSLDRHRMLTTEQALTRAPGLARAGLRGAALYYDAQVEYAERLTVENAIAAAQAGAVAMTYARVDRLLRDGNTVTGVAFTDLLGGDLLEARSVATINVSGPWVDDVLAGDQADGTPGRPPRRLIGGTKGSHIVVDPFSGAPRDALYIEARRDGRPFFVIPWNGQYLIGTTDIRYEGDLDRVVASVEEIAYLLEETLATLPGSGLTRESVRYTYSGVRPLPNSGDGSESAITRRHAVKDHGPEAAGLFSVIGGKLTTYRELAEQATDEVVKHLGRDVPKSTTGDLPLPGATGADGEDFATFRAHLVATSELPAKTVDHLLRVYGTRAEEVLAVTDGEADLAHVFDSASGAIGAEVVFAVNDEGAQTLADILLRRTMVGLGPDAGVGADVAAAEAAGRHLGWDADRRVREVDAYRAYITRFTPRVLTGHHGISAGENAGKHGR
jgi:glycerol-3-phosphate dehydrogenase